MSYISFMNKFTLTLLLLLLSSFYLAASDIILDYLSPEERSTLYSSGEISRYFFDTENPEYLFNTTFSDDFLNEFSNLDITIGVESLYFLKYNESFNGAGVTPLSIYNTLLSIKTMKGIEYYSQSREKMRTLFTESYGISNLDDQEPLADPVVETIPSFFNRFLLQTDKTFGENLYKSIYRYDKDVIWVNMTNKTKMKYMFIPMLKPEKMSINLFILQIEEGLLFYGITAAETISFFGLEKAKKESFYNRMKAMFIWFSDQIGMNTEQQ